jgi:hypothetical protein
MTGIFDELMQVEEESSLKILVDLLHTDNIEMKTDIQKPLNFTKFEILGDWLKAESMKKSSKSVSTFAFKYRVNMVSHNRKSREETIRALTEILKEERNLTDKLISPPEKA